MFQRVATISSSVKQDATASHNVKSVMETLTVLMAATKPTAVSGIPYLDLQPLCLSLHQQSVAVMFYVLWHCCYHATAL